MSNPMSRKPSPEQEAANTAIAATLSSPVPDDTKDYGTPKRKARPLKPELRAMQVIDRVLSELDPEVRDRMLTWVMQVWHLSSAATPANPSSSMVRRKPLHKGNLHDF